MGFWSRLFGRGKRKEGPTCVACESTDLEPVAESVYRCRGCGYEGGDGYAAYKEQQKFARIDALSPGNRYRHGIAALREARRLLEAAAGDLAGSSGSAAASGALSVAVLGAGLLGGAAVAAGSGGAWSQTTALGWVLEAGNKANDARYALTEGPVDQSARGIGPEFQSVCEEIARTHGRQLTVSSISGAERRVHALLVLFGEAPDGEV